MPPPSSTFSVTSSRGFVPEGSAADMLGGEPMIPKIMRWGEPGGFSQGVHGDGLCLSALHPVHKVM